MPQRRRTLTVWTLVTVMLGGYPMSDKHPQDAKTPVAAVYRWWMAWEKKDLGLLEAMALEDYVEFTGSSESPRLGRATLLEVARRAFQRATVLGWEVIDPVVRQEGHVAVVVYRWTEQAILNGRAVSLQGVATDVLVNKDGIWRYLSHHSTPLRVADKTELHGGLRTADEAIGKNGWVIR